MEQTVTVELKTVTLVDDEIFSKMTVNPVAAQFASGPNQGKDFYRAQHAGKNFIVTPEFKEAWEAGEVATVTLVENKYEQEIDDPDNVGSKIKVQREGWLLSGAATQTQLEMMEKAKQKRVNNTRKLKLEAAVEQRKTIDGMNLDESAVKELLAFL